MLDITQLQNIGPAAVVLVPLVTGVVEVIKRTSPVTSRFLPLISVAVGLVLGLLVFGLSVFGAVAGVTIGLAATGLWEFGNKVPNNFKK